MYKIKPEYNSGDFGKDKEMFDFSIIQLSQNIMITQTN